MFACVSTPTVMAKSQRKKSGKRKPRRLPKYSRGQWIGGALLLFGFAIPLFLSMVIHVIRHPDVVHIGAFAVVVIVTGVVLWENWKNC